MSLTVSNASHCNLTLIELNWFFEATFLKLQSPSGMLLTRAANAGFEHPRLRGRCDEGILGAWLGPLAPWPCPAWGAPGARLGGKQGALHPLTLGDHLLLGVHQLGNQPLREGSEHCLGCLPLILPLRKYACTSFSKRVLPPFSDADNNSRCFRLFFPLYVLAGLMFPFFRFV